MRPCPGHKQHRPGLEFLLFPHFVWYSVNTLHTRKWEGTMNSTLRVGGVQPHTSPGRGGPGLEPTSRAPKRICFPMPHMVPNISAAHLPFSKKQLNFFCMSLRTGQEKEPGGYRMDGDQAQRRGAGRRQRRPRGPGEMGDKRWEEPKLTFRPEDFGEICETYFLLQTAV